MDYSALGRIVIIVAVALLLFGALMIVIDRLTGGRGLPGDVVFHRGPVTWYIPIVVSSIVISIVLSLLLSLIAWLIQRSR